MLVEELREKYLESGDLERLLQGTGIEILKDFLENWDAVLEFNRVFYAEGEPKTVLCGINPGRLGAGKTGVPFMDFRSLSKLLPGATPDDTERSAQFFHEVVSHFGAQNFYRSFYVGNVSWVGYSKERKNINFDALPVPARDAVLSFFRYEMSRIKPSTVISIGGMVQETVKRVLDASVNTDLVLPHPNYCGFPQHKEKWIQRYIEALKAFLITR